MQEWRIVHGTKGSALKQLWVRLRSGLWAPTERFVCDAQMMPIMGGSPGTVDKQVGASADDGRRHTGSNGFLSTGTSEYVGYLGGATYGSCHIFARWTGVTISGTIDVSYIEGMAKDSGYKTQLLKVYGVDEDNPAAPTSAAEFDADPLTGAAVDWDADWVKGVWTQSPSLNTVFQELVDTYAISNEAVMVQVKSDSDATVNYCNPYMWDESGNVKGLKLHIEYSVTGPTPGWNQLQYTSEPPTPNAWNQLKQEAGSGDYKSLFYEGE